MRLAVLIALVVFAVGCSHSTAPQIASQSQSVVPSILQTGTPPLQWAQILTNEPTGERVFDVARDTHSNEWFTEGGSAGNFIGYVSMNRGVAEWPVGGIASSIVAGPDGNMWFTLSAAAADKVAKITPTGVITAYPQPGGVFGICNGPDGNLWFGASTAIAKITPLGLATYYTIPGGETYNITICHKGGDGRVWFPESVGYDSHAMGAIDPTTSSLSQYPMSGGAVWISTASDGNIWFASHTSIGRITPTGSVTTFPLPAGEWAASVTGGTDGNVWFGGDRGVGEMTTAGTVVAWHRDPFLVNYTWPNHQTITPISAGSDGNMWVGTDSPAQIDAYIRLVLTASPSPVVLAAGTSTTLTVNETHYNGSFTVTSADPSIATVINAGTRTTFTINGVTHGTTTLTISDKYQNYLQLPVTVN